ncbi:MAG: CinA family protein [Rhodospirillaceae bacterium]|nr:CinA family protein [Rhodospirillaceae bacterium]
MFPESLAGLTVQILEACRKRGILLATAESCTGGLIAACLTNVPGSSEVVDRGFVTYSNDAKMDMLGVPAGMIAQYGAVSAEVASAMAAGALAASQARIAVAATGVAGPGGGTPDKPVGLVFIGIAATGRPAVAHRHQLPGDRQAVRLATVDRSLRHLMAAIDQDAD